MNIISRGRRGHRGHSAPTFNNQRGRGEYYSRGQFKGRSFLKSRGIRLHIKTIHNLTIVAVDILIMPAFEATAALIAI